MRAAEPTQGFGELLVPCARVTGVVGGDANIGCAQRREYTQQLIQCQIVPANGTALGDNHQVDQVVGIGYAQAVETNGRYPPVATGLLYGLACALDSIFICSESLNHKAFITA